jgi:hypothetical protein
LFNGLKDSSSDSAYTEFVPRKTVRSKKKRNISMSTHSESTGTQRQPTPEYHTDNRVGVPNVGWFDSAPEEQRRKRNQKKDDSVLDNMKILSASIKPEESVFRQDGGLVSVAGEDWHAAIVRPITGQPLSDGASRISGESTPELSSPPPPKKKQTSYRRSTILRNKVTNTGRVTKGLRGRRDSHHHPPRGTAIKRESSYYTGASEDDDLSYGPGRGAKANGLKIHPDNSGPNITLTPFSATPLMSMLTSGLHPPNQFVPAPAPFQPGVTYPNNFGGNVSAAHVSHYAAGTTFRGNESGNNPLGVDPHTNNFHFANLGSFGALSGSNNAFAGGNNPISFGGGNGVASQYQQQPALGAQAYNGTTNFFESAPINNFAGGIGGINNFAGIDLDMTGPQGGFNVATRVNGAENQMFLSSNREDDEATLSPPPSEC